MVCKFCHKKLPDEVDVRCPHCFAEWTPAEGIGNNEVKENETVKVEKETVNG